jgi:hypothetical protein
MGEGAGGGGQNKDLLVPPPLPPLPRGEGSSLLWSFTFELRDRRCL